MSDDPPGRVPKAPRSYRAIRGSAHDQVVLPDIGTLKDLLAGVDFLHHCLDSS